MAHRKRAARPVERETMETVDGEPMPLFEAIEGVDHLLVYRIEPVEDEGSLGQCEPTITEQEIFKRWGGGKYKITPRNSTSQFIPGQGGRTLKIAGEPKFSNEISRRKWLKNNGAVEEGRAPASGGGERQPTLMEMMMFVQKQSEAARLEMQTGAEARLREMEAQRLAREAESERNHKRQMELLQMQISAREADLKAQAQRLELQMQNDRERDREFIKTVTAAKGEGGGGGIKQTLELLAAARELFGGGGEGEADPLSVLAGNALPIIDRLSSMAKPAGAAGAQAPGRKAKPDEVVMEGRLGQKAQAVIRELARRGINPELALEQNFDEIGKLLAAQPAPAANPAPAQPKGKPAVAAPASAKTPLRKATRRSKGATKKSALPNRAAAAR